MVNYFLDTEFNQDGTFVELISIGVVDEDGREYYAQNKDCDFSRSNEFVREHVIPHLDNTSWKAATDIQRDLTSFLLAEGRPRVWTYYGNYDWVAVCGTLYGGMTNTPEGFPYRPFDLSQLAHHHGFYRGLKHYVPEPENAHNALVDAHWNRRVYEWIQRQVKNK